MCLAYAQHNVSCIFGLQAFVCPMGEIQIQLFWYTSVPQHLQNAHQEKGNYANDSTKPTNNPALDNFEIPMNLGGIFLGGLFLASSLGANDLGRTRFGRIGPVTCLEKLYTTLFCTSCLGKWGI